MNTFKLKKLTLANFATFKNELVTFNENLTPLLVKQGVGKALSSMLFNLFLDKELIKSSLEKTAIFAQLKLCLMCSGTENKRLFF